MLKFIITVLLVYFIYKIVKYLLRLVSAVNQNKNEHINSSEEKSRINIDQKDIIEAKFEEIKPEDEKKKPENE